jgi:hypothetical protein
MIIMDEDLYKGSEKPKMFLKKTNFPLEESSSVLSFVVKTTLMKTHILSSLRGLEEI